MERVKIEKEGNVAVVSLNSEERMNVIDLQSARDLLGAVYDVGGDDETRCVVLTGKGRVFCAGGDIRLMKKVIEEKNNDMKLLPMYLHAIIAEIRRIDKPVISAINGVVAGAGIGVALSADLVYASADTRFVLAYQNIGLSPDGGSTFLLAREIGYHRAMELMLTGRTLTAGEAFELGLINGVFEGDQLMESVIGIAKRIAAGPPKAFARGKQLFNRAFFEDMETQMELERQLIVKQVGTSEFKEGVSAFLEKRSPKF